jgi:MarR family transcriptional regulator, transcriptional regulator for hemolysin
MTTGRSRSKALTWLKNERSVAGRNPSLRRIVGAQEPPGVSTLRQHLWGWTVHTDLEDDFLVLLYDVARQMHTVADQMAREHGTTRAQFIILARLERQPGMSQNELAAIAEVAPITVARLVDRLEAQGLVERCTDPKDRRIWRLRLTPAAAPVLRDVKRYRAEVRALMTKGVNPAVLKAMVVGLRRMKENLSSSLAEAAE